MLGRLHYLPLRYRLSIPFFVLAFIGTFSLVLLAIHSQDELLRENELLRLNGHDRALTHDIELQGRWAVSLASCYARMPEVAAALAGRDRMRLVELCYPAYLSMKESYKISQFNFHLLPARNFVRLQRLYEFGDELDYRLTIRDAVSQRKEISGIERGRTGYGIRGVVPIYYGEEMVGTVEIGFDLGKALVEGIRKQFGVEASFLFPDGSGTVFRSMFTTFAESFVRKGPEYAEAFLDGGPRSFARVIEGIPYAVLVRTVTDYGGEKFALAEFCVDRSSTLGVMHRYSRLMMQIGVFGMIFSVAAIYILSLYFTRPIGEMVEFTGKIASGEHARALDANPSGELRVLASALDDMAASLKASQDQVKNYTENLEQMVQVRTRALHESEEKYRTLVENVPLVVYRLLGNGRTIFVNRAIEDVIGVPAREVLAMEGFWKEMVWEEDRPNVWPLMDGCLRDGRELKAVYRVTHANGKPVHVLDHALPAFDEDGKVETVDGFLLDVSERRRLQEQIVQTEELRTLSEVSERLAHEIRNPLVAAGGFARRLLLSMPESDPNREKVHIIVKEVARLEKILEKTLSYLKPFEILPERCSLNELLEEVLKAQQEVLDRRSLAYELDLASNLAPIYLDRVLFKRAMHTIFESLVGVCQSGHGLSVRTYSAESAVKLEIVVKGVQISKDDVDHFFFPFTAGPQQSATVDLPMAKMIIHKHQGLVHLRVQDSRDLSLKVVFPQ